VSAKSVGGFPRVRLYRVCADGSKRFLVSNYQSQRGHLPATAPELTFHLQVVRRCQSSRRLVYRSQSRSKSCPEPIIIRPKSDPPAIYGPHPTHQSCSRLLTHTGTADAKTRRRGRDSSGDPKRGFEVACLRPAWDPGSLMISAARHPKEKRKRKIRAARLLRQISRGWLLRNLASRKFGLGTRWVPDNLKKFDEKMTRK